MKTTVLCLTALLLTCNLSAQSAPQIEFKNATLISGTEGNNGAKYRFPSVCTVAGQSIDAIVLIKGRSANDVILRCIDSTGIGWDKAFQPCLGIPNVGANREWWMEFEIEFVKAGSSQKRTIDSFYVTGLDIDGDNGNLSEWTEMEKASSIAVSPVSNLVTSLLGTIIDILDPNNSGDDFRINGPRTNYANIDTSATAVMATYRYKSKDKIKFKLGGTTNSAGGSPGDIGIRMNSLWFKSFSLSPLSTLPVELTSFQAMLINNTNKVDLKWTTASEKNVSHFSVEKSTDGKNFTETGVVFAYGNTNDKSDYIFSDNVNAAKNGVIYYRLRTNDADGTYDYSAVRIIKTGKQSENVISISTYPNPVSDEVRITIPAAWQGKKVKYELINVNGQVANRFEVASSSQTETIDVKPLPVGMNIVKVTCEDETAQQRIIKK